MDSVDNARPALPYASVGRRFVALLVDGFIVGILSTAASLILPILGSLIVWFFYAPILESSEIRATLGKKLMGLQVANSDGTRVSFRTSLIRNLLKLVSTATVFIGFIIALFSDKKQALHDHLAETIVIDGESQAPITDAWVETTKRIFDAGSRELQSAVQSRPSDSLLTELERLQALRTQGAITEDEFAAAKKKIMS